MKFYQIIFLILCGVSCSKKTKIQSGDIIFRVATSTQLSDAINDVTQTSKATNYSHMGICEVDNDTIYVYHSDLDRGVVKESLVAFMIKEGSMNYDADIFRITNIEETQFKSVLNKAKSLLGESYNITYIMEDEGYYCSEFIYELFRSDTIFTLKPMTFKNPETNKFHKGWIDHYKNLGIEIPEGKLGCNPNGMASSKELMFVKKVK